MEQFDIFKFVPLFVIMKIRGAKKITFEYVPERRVNWNRLTLR